MRRLPVPVKCKKIKIKYKKMQGTGTSFIEPKNRFSEIGKMHSLIIYQRKGYFDTKKISQL